jgi:hypothetical protein
MKGTWAYIDIFLMVNFHGEIDRCFFSRVSRQANSCMLQSILCFSLILVVFIPVFKNVDTLQSQLRVFDCECPSTYFLYAKNAQTLGS